jgi:hypothetical protein
MADELHKAVEQFGLALRDKLETDHGPLSAEQLEMLDRCIAALSDDRLLILLVRMISEASRVVASSLAQDRRQPETT